MTSLLELEMTDESSSQPLSHKQTKKETQRIANPVIFLGRSNAAALKQEVLKVSRLLQGLEEEKDVRVRPPRIPKVASV